MADKDSIDVLMTFLAESTGPVAGEGTSKWDPTDPMMEDFQEGYFFEVDDFDFGIGLGDSESDRGGRGSGSSSSGNLGDNSLHGPPGRDGASGTPNAGGKSGSKFGKYIECPRNDYSWEWAFKPEIKEITITKQVDISSARFVRSCLTYGNFQKAVLVKRKFTDRISLQRAFLRLEFKEPLITGVEWDEGDIIREKLKFICRGIVIAYRPQSADGTLAKAKQTSWDYLDLAAR